MILAIVLIAVGASVAFAFALSAHFKCNLLLLRIEANERAHERYDAVQKTVEDMMMDDYEEEYRPSFELPNSEEYGKTPYNTEGRQLREREARNAETTDKNE